MDYRDVKANNRKTMVIQFLKFTLQYLTATWPYSEKDVNIEVDPDKIKSNSDRLQNVDKLKISVDAYMSAIVASEKTCPM